MNNMYHVTLTKWAEPFAFQCEIRAASYAAAAAYVAREWPQLAAHSADFRNPRTSEIREIAYHDTRLHWP